MRRSEVAAIFIKFKDLHERLVRSVACQDVDPEFEETKAEYDDLLKDILQPHNLSLFGENEKEFINSASRLFATPRYRLGVARARSRSRSASTSRSPSRSRDPLSSNDASFASSHSTSVNMADKSAGSASGTSGGSSGTAEMSRHLKELKLKYEMEEKMETLQEELVKEPR